MTDQQQAEAVERELGGAQCHQCHRHMPMSSLAFGGSVLRAMHRTGERAVQLYRCKDDEHIRCLEIRYDPTYYS